MQYRNMQTKELNVNGSIVLTDSEGYIVNTDDWSEDFVIALASSENLDLTDEHLEVVTFLRSYYELHRVQCEVRKIVKHFKKYWDVEKATSSYLHEIFPRGGPQKQGNRLAGLLRTKGEH